MLAGHAFFFQVQQCHLVEKIVQYITKQMTSTFCICLLKKRKKVPFNKFVVFLNISQYYILKVSKRTLEMILTTVCPGSRAVGEAVQGFRMIPGIHLDKR